MPRNPRKDRKPPERKMTARVGVKLTPPGRAELANQASKAGHASVSAYLRSLANAHRPTLGLPQFDYNDGVTDG